MKSTVIVITILLTCILAGCATVHEPEDRMGWWREARFGLFIHWGLYAVPAGEWNEGTNHAEWIRTTAQIPIDEYDKFVGKFNPVKFNADDWVRMAKDAGMKYIVITSKHHDGFCLFDSDYTDYDVMSTPFKRDIMKELADACRKEGIKMCWYHSIMDWHHPDYLPRRGWEDRSAEGAEFDRYVEYMKNQLSELTGNYGEIGVLWFDGEWESTWNHEYGKDLAKYVRSLQPSIILNNRVDVGRAGMEGMSEDNKNVGDFGTPEQQIPATGLPGMDWETCMTMNNHWGYNKNDDNWKSTEDLLRKLADIASKGGNFLLNVGPTAEGLFPQESVDRLAAMGQWMQVNGESIYGTTASPFESLPWGRCTVKALPGGRTRLYLHVFDWPENGDLVVPALDNKAKKAWLLSDAGGRSLKIARKGLDVVVLLPKEAPDPINSVVVLEIEGKPVVIDAPDMEAVSQSFIEERKVILTTDVSGAEIRYSLDGTEPDSFASLYTEPIVITESAGVKAAIFRKGKRISGFTEKSFMKVAPLPAAEAEAAMPGLSYEYYEGKWDKMPGFDGLEPKAAGTADAVNLDLRQRDEEFGLRFKGFLTVPDDGLYRFHLESDDGSQLFIGDLLVVDNDGLHSTEVKTGEIALSAGLHPVTVLFFQRSGGKVLDLSMQNENIAAGLIFRH